jgi:hypothetical protein
MRVLLVKSRLSLLFRALPAVALSAFVVGYAFALHASGIRFICLLVVVGIYVVPALFPGVMALFGPLPALTADGVQSRRRLVPWSQIQMLWIEYLGRQRYLNVLTTAPSRRKPYRVRLLDGSLGPHELDTAVSTLSQGQVELSDRGPEDVWSGFEDDAALYQRRALRLWSTREVPTWAYIVVVPLLMFTLPDLLDRPQPWRQPWWPGVESAAVAPDPCDAIAADVARDLFASAPSQPSDDGADHRRCQIDGNKAEMIVDYYVFNPAFSSSNDEASHHMFLATTRTDNFDPEPVPGLGDEAWIAGNAQGTTTWIDRAQALLVARRANVVVEVLYRGESQPDATRAAVLATAQRALGAVEIS